MRRGWSNNVNTKNTKLPLPVLGLVIALVVIAAIKVLASPQQASPHVLQPTALTLQQSNLGQGYRLMVNEPARPTQKALVPPPYQEKFLGGNSRYYMSANVFDATSLLEISNWAKAHHVPVTNIPTIVGTYVVDHHGVFTITTESLLYADITSAVADFHCCTYVDRQASFAGYQDVAVHIGDEATAFGGILDTPAHDPAYEMQLYAIRWRHGSVVSFLSVAGSHDVVFQDALRLAQIQDSNLTNG